MNSTASLSSRRVRAAWVFLAPMLAVLFLAAGWPLLRTIFFSFTDANLSDLEQIRFVGFDNYLANYEGEWVGILADATWWRAVGNTLWFSVITVTIETLLGLVIALVLNTRFPGRGLVRAAVLVPWAIPTIVSAKMWAWMLHDQFGIVNTILINLQIVSAPIAWTADPETALWAVVIVDVWKTTPFMALLILAGLQALPGEIYEAAAVDGVHPVQGFFLITLPLIWPAVMVAVIFRALDALRVFDLVYVLTSNSRDTMSMSVYARQQLVDFQEVGLGSAASTMLFVVIAVVTAVAITLGRVKPGGREA